jgi:methylmalonyl-CoA/ethylmalonyl-CoA epimerase
MTIKKIHHVAVVVPDIDEALSFWQDALGLDLSHVEDLAEQEVRVAFLPAGESEVELVKPTVEGSSLARYIAKRGPGLHHICFQVDDIEAMLAELKAKGVKLITEEPTTGAGGAKVAFVHPKSTGGVLVELYE